MSILRHVGLAGLALLIAAPVARAQEAWEITPFAGGTFFLADPPERFRLGDDLVVDNGRFSRSLTLGLTAGLRLNESWSVEAMGSWLPTNLLWDSGNGTKADVNAFMYAANLVYTLPLGVAFDPFIGLGVGGETFDYQIAGVDTHTDWMGNVLVGFQFSLNDRFGLRVAAYDCFARFESGVSGVDDAWENDLMTTFGLTFRTPLK